MPQNLVPTSKEAVAAYETTTNIFAALFREIKEIGRKKSDLVVSEFKVKQVNRLLTDMKEFLKDEPEGKYLDLLDAESLPQVADVILVMAQYEGALKAFHSRHYGLHRGDRQWVIK